MKTTDVIGIGNTLMDFLVKANESKLEQLNLKKGEMHLVEKEQAENILNNISNFETSPGGSAANTIKGIAFLGGNAILTGKVGNDQHGENYVQEMKEIGVNTRINAHHKTTGHAISLITPDSERTFSTHLGAATSLSKEDISEEDIANSKVLHIEGYLLEGPSKEVSLHAIELAKKHNTLISIDLADPALIRRNHNFLKELIRDIDIVFANETEAEEFTGLEEEEAVRMLGQHCKVAVVKIGDRGSLIHANNQTIKIPVYQAKAIDTTGAGDSFAAGFLYGYTQGWNLEKAGKLGSLLAAKIVEKIGVRINELNVEEILHLTS